MARHGLLILAFIAALLGAPPVASAAANALGSPSATPTTGTTDTVFVLRVRYEGQFPATGVTAVVGPRELAMSLVAGSTTSGTWSAAATLPAGAWPVTYTAVVLQGNAPSLSGTSLTVYDAATPPPTPVPTVVSNPPRTEAGGESPTSGSGGQLPAPPPAEAPAAPTPGAAVEAEAVVPAITDDGDPSGHLASPGESLPGPGTSSTPAPAADGLPGDGPSGSASWAPMRAPGTAEPPRDGVMAGTDRPIPGDESAGPASGEDEQLGMFLLLGLAGVAAVALVGSALLAVGRRRRTAEDPSPAEAAVTADSPVVTSRARRLARTADVDDDPILASLGIGRARTAPRSGPGRMTKRDGS